MKITIEVPNDEVFLYLKTIKADGTITIYDSLDILKKIMNNEIVVEDRSK